MVVRESARGHIRSCAVLVGLEELFSYQLPGLEV